jgi:4-aminobutyrate aminotransferase/(S)-3-amino-2-methylpropionate transaminase
LSDAPDIITFSKKMLTGGFYYKPYLTAPFTYQVFNTWMGDALRSLQLNTVIDVAQKHNLGQRAIDSGDVLYNGLQELSAKYPSLISNVRGRGTFLAFDCPNLDTRAALTSKTLGHGVNVGVSGEVSCRLRPALTFGPRHAAQVLDAMDKALGTM